MASYGEGLNFCDTWLDLPPQFMGTATSFGQQPMPLDSLASASNHGLTNTEFDMLMAGATMMPPPPPPPQALQPPIEHHASAEVLAAARLLQTRSAARANSMAHDTMFAPSRDTPPSLGPPVGHLRHQPMADFRQEGRRNLTSDEHDNTFADMVFGTNESRMPPRSNPSVDVQWGSDARFDQSQSFVPSNSETAEALEQRRMNLIECLEITPSRGNTNPSSPIDVTHTAVALHARRNSSAVAPEYEDAPPRKRRKSRPNRSDEDEDEAESSPATNAQRKPGHSIAGTTSSASPPRQNGADGRRRKSAANGAKGARENLTEQQKRDNHIRSEQKRRTIIKEGYKDLSELVPGVKGGGFSKSTLLGMAADFLDDLLEGNEALKAQLATLEDR